MAQITLAELVAALGEGFRVLSEDAAPADGWVEGPGGVVAWADIRGGKFWMSLRRKTVGGLAVEPLKMEGVTGLAEVVDAVRSQWADWEQLAAEDRERLGAEQVIVTEYAASAAQGVGPGWIGACQDWSRGGDPADLHAFLTDGTLSVYWRWAATRYNPGEKWTVHGVLDQDAGFDRPAGARPMKVTQADIGVSPTRPPHHVGKDIARRLIPAYQEELRRYKEARVQTDATVAKRDEVTARVVAALAGVNIRVKEHRTADEPTTEISVYQQRTADGGYVFGDLAAVGYRGGSVDLKLTTVPVEVAEAMLAVFAAGMAALAETAGEKVGG